TPALAEAIPSVSNDEHAELERAVDELGKLFRRLVPPEQPRKPAESTQREGGEKPEGDAQRGVPTQPADQGAAASGASVKGKTLPPAREKAYSQWKWAIEQNAEFSDETTDHEVYKWLEEHWDGDKLPSFASWSRYLRNARRTHGESKYSPRRGRTGRSIVS